MPESGLLLDCVVAFNLGLASQVHCVGMCGGIVTALGLALAPSARQRQGRLFTLALGYNLGRIASYTVAGVVVGALTAQVLPATPNAHRVLRFVAGAILVLSGLSLLGLAPRLQFLESWGLRLWRHVQPLGRRLLPVDRLSRALAFGLLWGFMPCALVYSSLLFAATRSSSLGAGTIMLAFGAGTLPAMLAATWFSARAPGWLTRPGLRRAAGALLLVAGTAYPFLDSHDHAHAHGGHADGTSASAPSSAAPGGAHEPHEHGHAASSISSGATGTSPPTRHDHNGTHQL